jgi:hypothetical protein
MVDRNHQKLAWQAAVLGGAAAGSLSALINATYFLAFRAGTGFSGAEPSLGSVTLSSLLPSILAGFGYALLQRLTPHSRVWFVLLTALITLGSFAGVFQETLPSGALKPAGFDQLVMPMHVVVGFLAAWLIPFFAACPANAPLAR